MTQTSPAARPAPARLRLWAELAVHALLLMELAWIVTWYQALRGFHESWSVDFVFLGGFFVASYWLSRLLSEWYLKRRWQRIFFVMWLAAALLISFKLLLYPDLNLSPGQLIARPFQAIFRTIPGQGEFWHLLIFTCLALRGIDIARSPVDQHRLLVDFQVGIFAFMLYGVAYSLTVQPVALAPLFLFLFFGLMALACGRVSQISELRGGRLPGIQSSWAAGIALAALALILIALLAGWIFDIVLARVVATFIYLVLALLTAIFLLLLSPFLLAIDAFIKWLQSRFTTPEAQETFNLFNQLMDRANQANDSLRNVANLLERFEPYLLVGLVVLLLLTAILWLGWRPLKQRLLGEEDMKNLPTAPLRLALPRLPIRRAAPLRRANQLLGAARIRQIYTRLLALSARLGTPRPPARTPIEFLPALAILFPGQTAELELITTAYLRVRYGLLPESDAEVQQVMDAWQAVNQSGRKLAALSKKQASGRE